MHFSESDGFSYIITMSLEFSLNFRREKQTVIQRARDQNNGSIVVVITRISLCKHA